MPEHPETMLSRPIKVEEKDIKGEIGKPSFSWTVTVKLIACVCAYKRMYNRFRNTRTETYVSCVACCPLVIHVEYAQQVLVRLEKNMVQTDGQTD